MAFDYITGTGEFNLSGVTAGADVTSPRDDNAWGAPAMETNTPTGNGTGVYVDSSWATALMGGLNKAVDYAIQRDAFQMRAQVPFGQVQGSTSQQVQVQRKQTNFMFLALCGVGIYLVAKS